MGKPTAAVGLLRSKVRPARTFAKQSAEVYPGAGGRRGPGKRPPARKKPATARRRAVARRKKASSYARRVNPARRGRILNYAKTTLFLILPFRAKRAKMPLRRKTGPAAKAPAAPRPAPAAPRGPPTTVTGSRPARNQRRGFGPGDPPQPAYSRGLSGCPLRPNLPAGRPAGSPEKENGKEEPGMPRAPPQL